MTRIYKNHLSKNDKFGLICWHINQKVDLNFFSLKEEIDKTLSFLEEGRYIVFSWYCSSLLVKESPIEFFLIDICKKNNLYFFGNVFVRGYNDNDLKLSKILSMVIFKKPGINIYERKNRVDEKTLLDSQIDTSIPSFTRDWANNVWHIKEKNMVILSFLRLSKLLTWSDEKVFIRGIKFVEFCQKIESEDLIPVVKKAPYHWK